MIMLLQALTKVLTCAYCGRSFNRELRSSRNYILLLACLAQSAQTSHFSPPHTQSLSLFSLEYMWRWLCCMRLIYPYDNLRIYRGFRCALILATQRRRIWNPRRYPAPYRNLLHSTPDTVAGGLHNINY